MASLRVSFSVRKLTPDAIGWPTRVCDLPHPPAQLFLAGTLPPTGPVVAIVGTRKPCVPAGRFAHDLARELGGCGWSVVSGGARGIDSEAHRGALAAGAHTLVVMGTPVERPYPHVNIELFSQIAKRGGLVSELARAQPVLAASFVQRNRIIAALADVVVVVEAPFKSGALSTAAVAKKLGRALMAVPHAPWDPRGSGCVGLLGGGAKICRSATDVLSLAAPSGAAAPARATGTPKKRKGYQGLDDDEQALLSALRDGPATVDELCELTGLVPSRVQRATLMLMLARLIQDVGGGRYASIARP